MVNKYMKKCSIFLAINEMHLKMTSRFQLTPIKMTVIKNTNNKCWQGFYTVGGNAN
jgi:hypothetical protein